MKVSMSKTIENLTNSIVGIRLGTISAGVVDTIKVPYHGTMTPIKHLAQTFPAGGGAIHIDPYDPTMTGQIANVLASSGLNAYVFSKTRVVVSVPPPSGEEKQKVISHLKKLAEEAKIAIRNIRKNHRQKISAGLDKEQLQKHDKEIQKVTDDHITEVDSIINGKIATI
jgi:ribosome recycling factor